MKRHAVILRKKASQNRRSRRRCERGDVTCVILCWVRALPRFRSMESWMRPNERSSVPPCQHVQERMQTVTAPKTQIRGRRLKAPKHGFKNLGVSNPINHMVRRTSLQVSSQNWRQSSKPKFHTKQQSRSIARLYSLLRTRELVPGDTILSLRRSSASPS